MASMMLSDTPTVVQLPRWSDHSAIMRDLGRSALVGVGDAGPCSRCVCVRVGSWDRTERAIRHCVDCRRVIFFRYPSCLADPKPVFNRTFTAQALSPDKRW